MPNRIERGRALPVDLWSDEPVFDIELTEIWHQDWIFATTTDAVADPGEFVPVTIGRQPVIVVRGDDYQLRAFANVCSHRGARLAECAGRASRFSCPYHAWTYDLEGTLVSVPYATPGEVSQGELGLREFHVATWQGLVFVSLAAEPAPLSERLRVIEPYIKPLGIDRLHHDSASVATESWNANWKIVFSNALDSYSNFRVHAETVEPVSPTDAAYYLAGSAAATVTGGESLDRADHMVISLPPSFVAVVFPDAMIWLRLAPVDVSTTEVAIGMAGQHVSAENGAVVSVPGWGVGFVDEDRNICEQQQSNANARWQPGPLLGIERALGDFNDYLAWRLVGSEPAPPFIAADPGARPEPGQ